jgi:PAS domain-containing protein
VIKPHVLVLTVAVFTLPVVITLGLKHAGEDGIEAQVHLQSMMTELRVQDGIEWRAVGGRISPQDVRKELVAARSRAKEHLEESEGLGLSSEAADRITKITALYALKVDQEVQLLATGDKKRVLDYDESQVDPAFEQVDRVLQDQSAQLSSDAESAQLLGDIGVLLTVLLSLVLVSVVQSRRRRADVSNRAKQQSEARYRTLIDQSSDLVLVIDREGHAEYVSPSAERLLAPRHENRLTTASAPTDSGSFDIIAAMDPADRRLFLTALQSAAPGRTPTGEFRISGRQGMSTYEVTVQDLTADPSVSGSC